MKKSMMTAIVIALFSVVMGFSGQAAALPLGYCGPENQGEVKSYSIYYSNGSLKYYYEYACDSGWWRRISFSYCSPQGSCTDYI